MQRRAGFCVLCLTLIGSAALVSVTLPASATKQEQTPFTHRRDPWLPEWMMQEPGGPGPMSRTMMARLLRQSAFLNYGVPKEYDGTQSSVSPAPEVIAEGRRLYQTNCSSCHGNNGLGDGSAGRALSPSPAVLAYLITRPIAIDPYLLWAISEGGKQFESDMPAFKDKLAREDIWKIIAFMRAGFPGAEGEPQGR